MEAIIKQYLHILFKLEHISVKLGIKQSKARGFNAYKSVLNDLKEGRAPKEIDKLLAQ